MTTLCSSTETALGLYLFGRIDEGVPVSRVRKLLKHHTKFKVRDRYTLVRYGASGGGGW